MQSNQRPPSGSESYRSSQTEYAYIIEEENHCCLCGTQLKFEHKFDYASLTIREDASCPSCRIQMKSKEHGIQ
jgi:hypothetical protein